jgi:predicted CXXCH cytochrome family protein
MKRTILAALLALLAGGALAPRPAQSLELVYPADKTYFLRSDFLIIKGGAAPPLEAIAVEINGAKSEPIDISAADYKAAFGDFLILQPDFDPGKNAIKLEGYAGGKQVAAAAAQVWYLDGDPTALPPAGYAPFVMHLPQKEKLCAPCHNMSPGQAELAAETEGANPCASCHKRMLAKKYVHGPAGVYKCAYCHDPASQPSRYRVRAHDAVLCNECHLDKVKKFNTSKFVHGPVGAGLCSVCHDPHASDQPAQLLAHANAICLGCHDQVDKAVHVVRGVGGKAHPLKDVPDPSNPGRMLTCASCHDPHGGQGNYFFARGLTGRFALCQLCHVK